ncbi:MAG: MBL fold metallo-hydrolase [Thermoplasmata archaeon]|nr:MBL fold metallo-hydrolase [Thermoplasmata archaeon]
MARTPHSGKHFRVHRIGPGVWSAIAEDGGYALCNAAIIDLGGRTVVFDSMLTPMAGAELALAARHCTGRAADFVVNSHWHGDHIRGNASFAPASVISTERTRRLIDTRGRRQWAGDRRTMGAALRGVDAPDSEIPPAERALYRGWFEGTLAVPAGFEPRSPDITFSRELSIHGSRRTLRLISYGGGHSPSDVFAYLPEEGVVFLGDLLSVGLHPSAGDGVPADWADMLRRIRGLGVDVALPGHGPVGGPDDLRRLESYLRSLDRAARSAVRASRSVAELRSSRIPAAFRDWKFSAFYAENLVRSYRLASTGVRPRR